MDNKYWFPAYTRAGDVLHFKLNDVHIREIIKYEDYKKFGANVKITYEGKDVQKVTSQRQLRHPRRISRRSSSWQLALGN